jgi:integral membrane sensor domain MASE1
MRYFNSRILFFSLFIPFILILIITGNASPQTSKNNEEEFVLYLKLSDLVKNTGDDLVQSMIAIESWDNMLALNILANVIINLQEISNGLDILVN